MWKLASALCLIVLSQSALAAQCVRLNPKPNTIVNVRTALLMGTRVQLPSNLIATPLVSNDDLWDVEGVVGTNQLFIKPNSKMDNGKQTMIFAYTEDGRVFDIQATRASASRNQACVLMNSGQRYFDSKTSQQLQSFVSTRVNQSSGAEVAQMRQQMRTLERRLNDDKKKAVVEALKKYRYHIYTRYTWEEGDDFIGQYTIADVYDDGRFTYIRLANPNKGVLSVTTEIGGKAAIAPVKYDDAYGIYRLTGIYPRFTLKVDDVVIAVERSDNRSKGAS